MFGTAANSLNTLAKQLTHVPMTGMRPASMLGLQFKPRRTGVAMAQGTRPFKPGSSPCTFACVTKKPEAPIINNRERCPLHGFAEYEQAKWMSPKSTLQFRDEPAGWFDPAEPLGYVAVLVLIEGESDLRTPVACHCLCARVPKPGQLPRPSGDRPGVVAPGPARTGPARRMGRRNHAAPSLPDGFCHAVVEEDLLPLGRLMLKGRSDPGAGPAFSVHRRQPCPNLRARYLALNPKRT
jgi:hypothetical protein